MIRKAYRLARAALAAVLAPSPALTEYAAAVARLEAAADALETRAELAELLLEATQ